MTKRMVECGFCFKAMVIPCFLPLEEGSLSQLRMFQNRCDVSKCMELRSLPIDQGTGLPVRTVLIHCTTELEVITRDEMRNKAPAYLKELEYVKQDHVNDRLTAED